MIRYACPACGFRMESATAEIGTMKDCPQCRQTFVVPKPPPAVIESTPPQYEETHYVATPYSNKVGKTHTRERWSGSAIAGFVLSLGCLPLFPTNTIHPERVGLFALLSVLLFVLAITFDIFGWYEVSSGSRQRGKGLAIAGLIITIFSFVVVVSLAAYTMRSDELARRAVIAGLNERREASEREMRESQAKLQETNAILTEAEDHFAKARKFFADKKWDEASDEDAKAGQAALKGGNEEYAQLCYSNAAAAQWNAHHWILCAQYADRAASLPGYLREKARTMAHEAQANAIAEATRNP